MLHAKQLFSGKATPHWLKLPYFDIAAKSGNSTSLITAIAYWSWSIVTLTLGDYIPQKMAGTLFGQGLTVDSPESIAKRILHKAVNWIKVTRFVVFHQLSYSTVLVNL